MLVKLKQFLLNEKFNEISSPTPARMEIINNSPYDSLAAAIITPINNKINYLSIIRQIFNVRGYPLLEGRETIDISFDNFDTRDKIIGCSATEELIDGASVSIKPSLISIYSRSEAPSKIEKINDHSKNIYDGIIKNEFDMFIKLIEKAVNFSGQIQMGNFGADISQEITFYKGMQNISCLIKKNKKEIDKILMSKKFLLEIIENNILNEFSQNSLNIIDWEPLPAHWACGIAGSIFGVQILYSDMLPQKDIYFFSAPNNYWDFITAEKLKIKAVGEDAFIATEKIVLLIKDMDGIYKLVLP